MPTLDISVNITDPDGGIVANLGYWLQQKRLTVVIRNVNAADPEREYMAYQPIYRRDPIAGNHDLYQLDVETVVCVEVLDGSVINVFANVALPLRVLVFDRKTFEQLVESVPTQPERCCRWVSEHRRRGPAGDISNAACDAS